MLDGSVCASELGSPHTIFESDSDVEKHFKGDFEETGSMTSEGDGGAANADQRSTFHSDEVCFSLCDCMLLTIVISLNMRTHFHPHNILHCCSLQQ